jgi:hypothetical protein
MKAGDGGKKEVDIADVGVIFTRMFPMSVGCKECDRSAKWVCYILLLMPRHVLITDEIDISDDRFPEISVRRKAFGVFYSELPS